jgi:hypothetical protein
LSSGTSVTVLAGSNYKIQLNDSVPQLTNNFVSRATSGTGGVSEQHIEDLPDYSIRVSYSQLMSPSDTDNTYAATITQ